MNQNLEIELSLLSFVMNSEQASLHEDAIRRIVADLTAEIQEIQKRLDISVKYFHDSTQQFNEGYEAYERGQSPDDAPHYEPDYDQWMVGWVWARYVHTEASIRLDDDADQYDTLIPEDK